MERDTLLHAAGQLALAYVTAKTHGLEEEAARVAEAIGEGHLPQVEGMLTATLCIACDSSDHAPGRLSGAVCQSPAGIGFRVKRLSTGML